MADIVLAEVSGHGWLIHGEEYIDDLLGNTLKPDVSIEIVMCESKSAVDALWRDLDGRDPENMWLIHPAILNRSKGLAAPMTVRFAPWSAALDPAALQTIQLAGTVADQNPAMVVTLVRTILTEPAPMAAELADLRSALIEAKLISVGVTAARTRRATTADGEPDHIQIAIQPS